MMSEAEQVEIWFDSLTADQQAAVLSVDFDDTPGWIVASLVAAYEAMKEDPSTSSPTDFKSRVPQVLADFVRGQRSAQ